MSGNFKGLVTVETLVVSQQATLPAGAISNSQIAAGAGIDADKLNARPPVVYGQAEGSDVASETRTVHSFRAAGSLVAARVVPRVAPTGGDKQYTVDVQKASDGSTSFSTLLTGVVTVDNTSADQTKQDGTLIADPSMVADSVLRIVVTASGSTGSQGQGLLVELTIQEPAPA